MLKLESPSQFYLVWRALFNFHLVWRTLSCFRLVWRALIHSHLVAPALFHFQLELLSIYFHLLWRALLNYVLVWRTLTEAGGGRLWILLSFTDPFSSSLFLGESSSFSFTSLPRSLRMQEDSLQLLIMHRTRTSRERVFRTSLREHQKLSVWCSGRSKMMEEDVAEASCEDVLEASCSSIRHHEKAEIHHWDTNGAYRQTVLSI